MAKQKLNTETKIPFYHLIFDKAVLNGAIKFVFPLRICPKSEATLSSKFWRGKEGRIIWKKIVFNQIKVMW